MPNIPRTAVVLDVDLLLILLRFFSISVRSFHSRSFTKLFYVRGGVFMFLASPFDRHQASLFFILYSLTGKLGIDG